MATLAWRVVQVAAVVVVAGLVYAGVHAGLSQWVEPVVASGVGGGLAVVAGLIWGVNVGLLERIDRV